MSNICFDIKKEYETLKTMKEAFVSACKEAGSIDALSNSELSKLKRMKTDLETARNILDDRIETKEAKTWTKIYEAVTSATVVGGPYKRMCVRDLIAREEFQKNISDEISTDIQEGKTKGFQARNAVIALRAACGLGLLSEWDSAHMQKEVQGEDFLKKLTVECASYAQRGQSLDTEAWFGVTTLRAAIDVGVPQDWVWKSIRERMGTEKFQNNLIKYISDTLLAIPVPGSRAVWTVIMGFESAYGLGFINTDARKKIQESMEDVQFQEQMISFFIEEAQRAQKSRSRAFGCAAGICAIKELIALTQRRKKK